MKNLIFAVVLVFGLCVMVFADVTPTAVPVSKNMVLVTNTVSMLVKLPISKLHKDHSIDTDISAALLKAANGYSYFAQDKVHAMILVYVKSDSASIELVKQRLKSVGITADMISNTSAVYQVDFKALAKKKK